MDDKLEMTIKRMEIINQYIETINQLLEWLERLSDLREYDNKPYGNIH